MLKVLKHQFDAILPTRNHKTDAGLDLYSVEARYLEPHVPTQINLGISIELPPNTVGKIEARSSMGKRGIGCLAGVVDEGYRGQLTAVLINHTNDTVYLDKGSKVAQLLIYTIQTPESVEVGKLSYGERGDKAFGSSGV